MQERAYAKYAFIGAFAIAAVVFIALFVFRKNQKREEFQQRPDGQTRSSAPSEVIKNLKPVEKTFGETRVQPPPQDVIKNLTVPAPKSEPGKKQTVPLIPPPEVLKNL